MRIYLTRHGQPITAKKTEKPQYPSGDPPLSDLGRLQARKLGERLKAESFSGKIFASPYRRTSETADIIACVNETFFYPEPAIREITTANIESFTGMNLQQLRKQFTNLSPDSTLNWPWWSREPEVLDESKRRPQVEARVGVFLDKIMSPDENDILLVTHAGAFSAAVEFLLELEHRGEFRYQGLTWNCALSEFRLDENGLFPLYHGCVKHLEYDEITANSQRPADIEGAEERIRQS